MCEVLFTSFVHYLDDGRVDLRVILQKHSVRCTEQFARENVLEEMKDLNATPESKQKMMEALKRIHFDDEGRSVFEDEYMQDLNGEDDEEPSASGMTFLTTKVISTRSFRCFDSHISPFYGYCHCSLIYERCL